VLSITLNNKKSYNITVKKNCRPRKQADRFCYENSLGADICQDLTELLEKYLTDYNGKKENSPLKRETPCPERTREQSLENGSFQSHQKQFSKKLHVRPLAQFKDSDSLLKEVHKVS